MHYFIGQIYITVLQSSYKVTTADTRQNGIYVRTSLCNKNKTIIYFIHVRR